MVAEAGIEPASWAYETWLEPPPVYSAIKLDLLFKDSEIFCLDCSETRY